MRTRRDTLPSVLRHALELEDFQRLARPRLPRATWGYVVNGCDDNAVVHTNRTVFERWRLLPRVLRDVSARAQETTLFGQRWAAPFGISPMGSSAVIAYDGDNRLARAAHGLGIPFVLSANSITPLEEVIRHNPDAWFAAYQRPEADKIARMVGRVAAAGFKTFVLTVDVPVGANRPRDARDGFSMPLRPNPRLALDGLTHPRWLGGTALRTVARRGMPKISNVEADDPVGIFSHRISRVTGHAAFTWKQVALIRSLWPGTFVVKGLLSPEDAAIAREEGVDGIVVSNHGGRQLGSCVSPMEVLAEIKAVSGAMTVIAESGFRRGTDVLKALALGADFVMVGRPFLFAAALAGEAGIVRAAQILWREIDVSLGLLGAADVAGMGPEYLRPAGGQGVYKPAE